MWKSIYDQWLDEGDLKLLIYLQNKQRYLKRSRSKQEVANLRAQIEGLMEVKYKGVYRYFQAGENDLNTILLIMHPRPLLDVIPNDDDFDGLVDFFANNHNIRINPQVTEHLFCHPCWILWTRIYKDDNKRALWAYRQQFIYYMELKDYNGAARVYQHAVNMKERVEPLPILSPYVLRKVMYCNTTI
jgi:hypothetical protein